MKKRVVIKSGNQTKDNKKPVRASKMRYVRAAEGDEDIDMDLDLEDDDDVDGLLDAIDDVSDDVEDIQDSIDDMEEDDIDIATNNNIENHYIAECDKCKSVFISAIIESDQHIESVSGVCPNCRRNTEQTLKWVIKAI